MIKKELTNYKKVMYIKYEQTNMLLIFEPILMHKLVYEI